MDNLVEVTPWQLKKPKKRQRVFEVTDESNPGVKVTLTLTEPSLVRMIDVEKSISFYTNLYLVPQTNGEIAQLPFPQEEGQELEVVDFNEELIQLACAILGLQSDNKLKFEEIVLLMHQMEVGILPVIVYAQEVLEKFEKLLKNPTLAQNSQQLDSTQELLEDTPHLTTE